jgi:hypothetical protein
LVSAAFLAATTPAATATRAMTHGTTIMLIGSRILAETDAPARTDVAREIVEHRDVAAVIIPLTCVPDVSEAAARLVARRRRRPAVRDETLGLELDVGGDLVADILAAPPPQE